MGNINSANYNFEPRDNVFIIDVSLIDYNNFDKDINIFNAYIIQILYLLNIKKSSIIFTNNKKILKKTTNSKGYNYLGNNINIMQTSDYIFDYDITKYNSENIINLRISEKSDVINNNINIFKNINCYKTTSSYIDFLEVFCKESGSNEKKINIFMFISESMEYKNYELCDLVKVNFNINFNLIYKSNKLLSANNNKLQPILIFENVGVFSLDNNQEKKEVISKLLPMVYPEFEDAKLISNTTNNISTNTDILDNKNEIIPINANNDFNNYELNAKINQTLILISAPICSGQRNIGPYYAPEILLSDDIKNNLNERWSNLIEYKSEVVFTPDIYKSEKNINDKINIHNYDYISKDCKLLYDLYKNALIENANTKNFILTIGGDHSVTLSTVKSRLDLLKSNKKLCIIYIDAHLDLNTPITSDSGNYHGMELAHLIGWFENKDKLNLESGFEFMKDNNRISEYNLVLLCTRAPDSEEYNRLTKSNIKYFDMEYIKAKGMAQTIKDSIDILDPYNDPNVIFHVSFDVDAIDPEYTIGTGTPVNDGISNTEAFILLDTIAKYRCNKWKSLDIVEVDPIQDNSLHTTIACVKKMINTVSESFDKYYESTTNNSKHIFNNYKVDNKLKKNTICQIDEHKNEFNNHIQINNEKPLLIIDFNILCKQFLFWKKYLPNVTPFYAVKSNPDKYLIEYMIENKLVTNFDCASVNELKLIDNIGKKYEDTTINRIYAHCIKDIDGLTYYNENKNNIKFMTFDCNEELIKINKYCGKNADLVLRVNPIDISGSSKMPFGKKFGANMNNDDAVNLLINAKNLGMNVIGISFHCGSYVTSTSIYYETLRNIAKLWDYSYKNNLFNLEYLDLGGGFVPVTNKQDLNLFKSVSIEINNAIKDFYSNYNNIKIIAEPGRYFSAGTGSLFLKVIGVKKENDLYKYYLNSGVYSICNNIKCDFYNQLPIPYYLNNDFNNNLNNDINAKNNNLITHNATIFGPTCDSIDVLFENIKLPGNPLNFGDWVMFKSYGAYTLSLETDFNGMPRSIIKYINIDNKEFLKEKLNKLSKST